MKRVAINQNRIRFNPGIFNGTEHGFPDGFSHPDLIDMSRRYMTSADRLSDRANLARQFASFRRGQLLGVIDAPDLWVVRKGHGTNRKRAGNGTSTHLVKAEDDTLSPKLAHQTVHSLDAHPLDTLLFHAPLSYATSSKNLSPGVLGIPGQKSFKLVFGRISQRRGYFCGCCGMSLTEGHASSK